MWIWAKKLLHFVFISIVVFGWIFSGWPQIYNFPPPTQKAQAAVITYVGGQVGSSIGTTGNTTVSFALTGGTGPTPQAGDLVIISFSNADTGNKTLTITNDSAVAYDYAGGSDLYQNGSTYDSNFVVGYRFMSETPETSALLAGGDGSGGRAWAVHVFRNVDPVTPLDVAVVTAGGTGTHLADPGEILPTTAGAWIYVAGAGAVVTGADFVAGYLTDFQTASGADTQDGVVGAGYATWTSGTYNPAAFTGGGTDSSADSWNAITLALKPGEWLQEQEGFAFGDDDDIEADHTLDTQDTNITAPLGTKTLRTIINTNEDVPVNTYKLKYQKNGSGGYADVPTSASKEGFRAGLSDFLTEWSGVHTAFSFNSTNANTGTDNTHDANSSSYAQTETNMYPDYGVNTYSAPDQDGDFDILTVTDAAMLLYIPSNLATGVYGLWWNGGTTNAQGAFIRSESNGTTITLGIQHNSSSGNDYTSYALTERGWVMVGFQFEDNSGNMAIWVNGVNVQEVARSYALLYGSGNPGIGDNNADDFPDWGGESTINGTGILIANFVADNPNSTNTTPPGTGDDFYTDYYNYHVNSGMNEVYVSASDNVAGGGEDTTARLTAPSGKSGNFTTGRRWDDENGEDVLDVAGNHYTELEWVLTTQAPATTDDYFEFRVYNVNVPLYTYTLTPKWTIGTETPVYSVSITPGGLIEYGFVGIGMATTTLDGYTKTAQNDGGSTEKLNVKSSDATNGTTWTLASDINDNQFKHEFSTTTGVEWTVMPDSSTYVTADPSVATSGTVDFDFRLTVPSSTSDYVEKSITITIQAVAP